MTTRRTTRRSVAASATNENSLAATGTGPALAGTKKLVVAGASKAKLAVKTTTAKEGPAVVAGASRKRVLGDVTNATKAKADNNTTAKIPVKTTVVSSAATRRTIRTRSSTGGVEEEEEEVKSDENAMNIDGGDKEARQIKSLRTSRIAKAARTTVVAMDVKTATATAAKVARAPLQSKTTNTRAAAATKSTVSKAASATALRQVRERRLAAQAAIDAATVELEAALLEEQEHAAKRLRTSEPEAHEEEEEASEDEEVIEMDGVVGGRSPMVNGVGMKDEGWIDLDDGDEDDPLMVSSYVVEVYEYMRELELTTMADCDYMRRQNEVTWKMRGILVDWLVEIHSKFRLLPETIFLATNIIDRFLSVRVVSLVKFQLVGVTALFIASKYEEVVCPSVSNFLYMTDGGYEDDEILKAERYVLNMIDFNLSYPNPINFLRRISKADGYDITSRTVAKYLMEISIVDNRFLGSPPSLIAAAGSWLARKALSKGRWDANLVHYSGYTQEELLPTAQLMLDYVIRSSTIETNSNGGNPLRTLTTDFEVEHPNFMKKYAGKKFFKASSLIRTWAEEEYAPRLRLDPVTGLSTMYSPPTQL